MKKTAIMQDIIYEEMLRNHEKKAKREIIKQMTAEYIAEGVDKKTAQIMAKTFYEYNI